MVFGIEQFLFFQFRLLYRLKLSDLGCAFFGLLHIGL